MKLSPPSQRVSFDVCSSDRAPTFGNLPSQGHTADAIALQVSRQATGINLVLSQQPLFGNDCRDMACMPTAMQGLYDPKSKIPFRALAVKERRLDDALIEGRLQRALTLRQRLFHNQDTTGQMCCC